MTFSTLFLRTLIFRATFAAAREGHLPRFLAMIHTKTRTPLPGIIFSVSYNDLEICSFSFLWGHRNIVMLVLALGAIPKVLFLQFRQ